MVSRKRGFIDVGEPCPRCGTTEIPILGAITGDDTRIFLCQNPKCRLEFKSAGMNFKTRKNKLSYSVE